MITDVCIATMLLIGNGFDTIAKSPVSVPASLLSFARACTRRHSHYNASAPSDITVRMHNSFKADN